MILGMLAGAFGLGWVGILSIRAARVARSRRRRLAVEVVAMAAAAAGYGLLVVALSRMLGVGS